MKAGEKSITLVESSPVSMFRRFEGALQHIINTPKSKVINAATVGRCRKTATKSR